MHHDAKLQALCLRSWHLPASPQRWPQPICVHLHLRSENDKAKWQKYTQTKSAGESTIQNSQVTVVAIGRVSWVNPGNAGSAAILRSRKTGKTCQAGNATPVSQAPITSRCTCGSKHHKQKAMSPIWLLKWYSSLHQAKKTLGWQATI